MPKTKPFLLFGAFFSCWIILISNFWQYPLPLLLSLIAISLGYFAFTKNKREIYIFVIAGVVGPIGEAVVASSGLWTYHGETIFGIPYWLPLAWGITAVAIFKLISKVVE
jgi:hypothetical protein